MAVEELRVWNLRNLQEVVLEPAPQRSLFFGENGAGKTSLLEGVFLLGRGRTFRRGRQGQVVGPWGREAIVSGRVSGRGGRHRMGMRRSRDGSVTGTIDGRQVRRSGELAELLPVRVIGPECQQMVEGGASVRQRYLDWGVFHVKPPMREVFQRFRRALEQRNAALRSGLEARACQAWDRDLVESAELMDEARRAHLELIRQTLPAMALFQDYLPQIELEYRSGWDGELGLAAQLARTIGADRQAGWTGVGPHRGDVRLTAERRGAAVFLSRGQQKALAVALLLAQIAVVDPILGSALVVLVDDLPSELDRVRLEAALSVLKSVRGQILATALDSAAVPEPIFERMFHVKQGQVTQVV